LARDRHTSLCASSRTDTAVDAHSIGESGLILVGIVGGFLRLADWFPRARPLCASPIVVRGHALGVVLSDGRCPVRANASEAWWLSASQREPCLQQAIRATGIGRLEAYIYPKGMPPCFLRFARIAESIMARALFHEVGHHIHCTQSRDRAPPERVAERWADELLRDWLLHRWWFLCPILLVSRRLVPRRLAASMRRRRRAR
jgi:hypothetical protein